MIKENQTLLNQLNVLSDALILFLSLPLAFLIRFYVFTDGIITEPFVDYVRMSIFYTLLQMFTMVGFGVYQPFRKTPMREELRRLWKAGLLDMLLLQSLLFLSWGINYSRMVLLLSVPLGLGTLSLKRVVVRRALRSMREQGYNQKDILILGCGRVAKRFLDEIHRDRELGYNAIGYMAQQDAGKKGLRYLGSFEQLPEVLEKEQPEEVIFAGEPEDFSFTRGIINACESAGIKLAIIPFFVDYMPSTPKFDDLNGIPLMNIRRIPLDNWANAFLKRAMDIVGSSLLLVLSSPVMLICAIGVRLSSPGPVIFKQKRVGLNKKIFYMYKFRSMRVNDAQDTAWSGNQDPRKTRFGAFIRKYSLDELPQFWNVLKGDMSLVGPRPEIPYYVERFREEVPLYMVKHQVRPGITGWAQVHDLRGDTSIKKRIEYDIYYIEHWSLWLDIQILWMTVFRGKFKNDEKL